MAKDAKKILEHTKIYLNYKDNKYYALRKMLLLSVENDPFKKQLVESWIFNIEDDCDWNNRILDDLKDYFIKTGVIEEQGE